MDSKQIIRISLFHVLLVNVYAQSSECPTTGKLGGLSIPDVTSLIKNQNSYHAKMEVITGSSTVFYIDDYYNEASQAGWIKLLGDQIERREVYYYKKTQEFFVIDIDNDKCESNSFTDSNKADIINFWLPSVYQENETIFFGKIDNLGPVGLLIYLKQLSAPAYYMGTESCNGLQANHWMYCVTDNGPFFEFFFDVKTNLPLQLTINYPNNDASSVVFNIHSFEPLIADLVSYPFGYGCTRQKAHAEFPKLLLEDNISLEMEATIHYNSPTQKTYTTSVQLITYQGITSYDIIDGPKVYRTIFDPILNLEYTFANGTCQEDKAEYFNAPKLHWPYYDNNQDSDGIKFNLLLDHVLNLEESEYLGLAGTPNGLMEVYEKKIYAFFDDDEEGVIYGALLTYFIPVITHSFKARTKATPPDKILIKSFSETSFMSSQFPSSIEINFIDYQEGLKNAEIGDRFDISNCYSKLGSYTWFQVVFPDNQASNLDNKLSEAAILESFGELVSSFIPKIRLPELRVEHFKTDVYVTGKLLARPDYKYLWRQYSKTSMINPTKVLIREYEEDCSEICLESESCVEFVYCSNLQCLIYDAKIGYPTRKVDESCNLYQFERLKMKDISEIENNILRSSHHILQELKLKIEKNEISINYPAELTAIDLFIVSSPEEIGGLSDEFKNTRLSPLSPDGHNYEVYAVNYRFESGERVSGVSYQQCLAFCSNDDECAGISHCPSRDSECTLASTVSAGLDSVKRFSTGCTIYSKSWLANFRKFPGKSLVKSAAMTLTNHSINSCAQTCIQTKNFDCRSFDFCSASDLGSNMVCALHTSYESSTNEGAIPEKVWDSVKSSCDHYAREVSKEFNHLAGRRFRPEKARIIQTLVDVSLERCAAHCKSFREGCQSFEYCEVKSSSDQLTSNCRISTYRPSDSKAKDFETTLDPCSVFILKNYSPLSVSTSKLGLALGLGVVFFIIAFVAGLFGSIYWSRRQNV